MTTSPTRTTLDTLASCYLHDAKHTAVIKQQLAHRLNLAAAWGMQPGWNVLDVGCGQGDSTLSFAEAVSESGHVTGIDPGSPNYGSPTTLGQCQAYISKSRMGSRITFKRADAPSFLSSLGDESTQPTLSTSPSTADPTNFDAATLCHSLWYFDSRTTVQQLFAALAGGRVKRVLLAEYTGLARTDEQKPHELAAQVQVQFHHARLRGEGDANDNEIVPNVREALLPAEIVREAEAAGWAVAAEGVLETPQGMMDGKWEVATVLDPAFMGQLMSFGVRGTTAEMLNMVQEIRALKDELSREGKDVTTMDVAWVVLERKE